MINLVNGMIHSTLNIGLLKLPLYGLSIVIGVFIANIIIKRICDQKDINWDGVILVEAYFALGGILGGKLLYLLLSLSNMDWKLLLDVEYFNQWMSGGFVFYGAIIGAMLVALLGCKIHHIAIKPIMDEFLYLIPFMHAFGRIGCFFAGCCYGVEYDGLFAIQYASDAYGPHGISLFPVQLLETVCLFVISYGLYQVRYYPVSIDLYLLSYAIVRFCLEYLRGDVVRGIFGYFSTSQWISLLIIIIVFTKNIIMFYHKDKRGGL